MTDLKVFYVHFSHRAGASRNVILHATSPAVAERMAWMQHQGSRHNWSVTIIEAERFDTLEILR